MTEARENKTTTLILARIAEFQKINGNYPRQKDIRKKVPLTKGAVSQEFDKLMSESFIVKNEENTYSINKEKLVNSYREHLEDYLIREEKNEIFRELIDSSNEIRTQTNRQLDILLDKKENKEMIKSILLNSLISSIERDNIATLREVFLWTDNVIRQSAYHIFSCEKDDRDNNSWMQKKLLFMISICLNHYHKSMYNIALENEFIQNHFPGKPLEKKMLEDDFGGKIR